tara:strand:+ start:1037 stop:2077 length:1041 start_codon:yes stop_codon:yes gene_type:complete
MKFTGAVLVNTNQPLVFVPEIQVPQLKPGQVLVKVIYAGVCHSQLMEQQGKRGEDKYLPHLLGHEGTGVVLEVGPNVTKVKAGDKVILGWLKGDGEDAGGTVYQSPIGNINSGAVTTFSELTVVSENRCYLLPNNISMQEGVLLGCALPTGMGIVTNQIKPNENTTIGIVGLGGIGMSALIGTTCLPHQSLIAIDTNEQKLALAKTLGADYCINPAKQDVHAEIQALTAGNMLDFAVEAAGSCQTIELAFSLINKQTGHCIFASHPPAGQKIQLDPFELICGKTITGSWGGCSHPEHMSTFVSEHKSKINLVPFMSNLYELKDINRALSDLEQQKVMRAIVEVNPI